MKIEILGCSGGIGPGLKTTSFLIDETLLLDAGTGIETLPLESMLRIRGVLITHAHIDHICGLPLMLATIYDRHQQPIDLYALPEVVAALRTHIFNWTIWPDYTQLPEQNPIIRLHEIQIDQTFSLQGKTIQVLPATHPTPTAGYLITDDAGSFAFSGDNGCNPELWPRLNKAQPDLLIMDVSFTDDLDELATVSGHLTPAQLADELRDFDHPAEIRITHLKPGFEAAIIEGCQRLLPGWKVSRLIQGETLTL